MPGTVFAMPLSAPRTAGAGVVFTLLADGSALVRFMPRYLAIEAAGPKIDPQPDGTVAFAPGLHYARTIWRARLPDRAPFNEPAQAFATDPDGTAQALIDVWRWHAEHAGRVLCRVGSADDLTALLTGLADIHRISPASLAVRAATSPDGTASADLNGRWAGRARVERLLSAALGIMKPAGFTAGRGSVDAGADFLTTELRVRAQPIERSAHRSMRSRADVLRVVNLLAVAADGAAPGSSVALRRAATAVLEA